MEPWTPLPTMALAALLGWTDASYAQTVKAGVTGAARRDTTGMLRGQPPTALRIGADVFIGERITTDADGRSQLLFPRGARLFVEPNSSVVLLGDWYDSSAATGRIDVSILQGQIQLSVPRTLAPGVGSETRAEHVDISIDLETTQQRDQSNPTPLLAPFRGQLKVNLSGSGMIRVTQRAPSVELLSLGTSPVFVTDPNGNRVAVRPGFFVTYNLATGGLSAPQRIPLASMQGSTARTGARVAAQPADLPPLTATDAGPRSLASLDPRWLDVVGGLSVGQLGGVREQTAITNEVRARLLTGFQGLLPAIVTVTDANGTRTASVSVGTGGRLIVSPSGQSIEAFLGQTRPLPVTVRGPNGTQTIVIPR